jgi:hypothetical protein
MSSKNTCRTCNTHNTKSANVGPQLTSASARHTQQQQGLLRHEHAAHATATSVPAVQCSTVPANAVASKLLHPNAAQPPEVTAAQYLARLTRAAVPAPRMLLVVNVTLYPGCPSVLLCSQAFVIFKAVPPAAAASSLAPYCKPDPNTLLRPPSCPACCCCCCCSDSPAAAADVSGAAASCTQVLLPGRLASSHVLALKRALLPVARLTTRIQDRCHAADAPAKT